MRDSKVVAWVVKLAWCVAVIVACASMTQAASASTVDDKQPATSSATVERWYVLQMQGQRAGWMHTVEKTGDELVTSSTRMELRIKRGALEIPISMQSRFEETKGGKPKTMVMEMKLGAAPQRTETIFREDGVEVITGTGESKLTSKRPLPSKPFMPPAAAAKYVQEQLAAGAKVITVSTIDPSMGDSVVTYTRTIDGPDNIDVFGRTVPAIKWTSTIDKMPSLKQTEWVSDAGEMIRTSVNLGGIAIETLAADKDLAMSKLDAPELLESTTVTPTGKPIVQPRTLATATYVIRAKSGVMPELEPAVGQTFAKINDQQAMVTVDARGTEVVLPEAIESARKTYTAPNAMLRSDDAVIGDLIKAEPGLMKQEPAKRAESLRRMVHGFISKKDMSVGFATASEVARTKVGDCTEHAVLLAALLRAAEIPSRVVSGLVYVDEFAGQKGVFGYHMWTQGLITRADGTHHWTNLDATLPDEHVYDATHITLATSSLSDDQMQNFLVATAPLIGRLEIEVKESTNAKP